MLAQKWDGKTYKLVRKFLENFRFMIMAAVTATWGSGVTLSDGKKYVFFFFTRSKFVMAKILRRSRSAWLKFLKVRLWYQILHYGTLFAHKIICCTVALSIFSILSFFCKKNILIVCFQKRRFWKKSNQLFKAQT